MIQLSYLEGGKKKSLDDFSKIVHRCHFIFVEIITPLYEKLYYICLTLLPKPFLRCLWNVCVTLTPAHKNSSGRDFWRYSSSPEDFYAVDEEFHNQRPGPPGSRDRSLCVPAEGLRPSLKPLHSWVLYPRFCYTGFPAKISEARCLDDYNCSIKEIYLFKASLLSL